jgi:hypothetical protein
VDYSYELYTSRHTEDHSSDWSPARRFCTFASSSYSDLNPSNNKFVDGT